jgi:hypothetical protein
MDKKWLWTILAVIVVVAITWKLREGFTLGTDPYQKPEEESVYAAKNPGLVQ